MKISSLFSGFFSFFRLLLFLFSSVLYKLFRSDFTVETNEKYVIITLRSGFRKSKILLPIRKVKLEKVFLCKEGKLIDITHPYDIDYFLTLEDLQGEYFLVKKNNTISKVNDLKNV